MQNVSLGEVNAKQIPVAAIAARTFAYMTHPERVGVYHVCHVDLNVLLLINAALRNVLALKSVTGTVSEPLPP